MDWNKNLKLKLWTAVIIFGMVAFLVFSFYENGEVSKMSKIFYNHKIVGKISTILMPNSRIELKIEKDNNVYDFSQQLESYQKNDFYKNVRVGDSIFKEAYSDTIFTKRDSRIAKYVIYPPK